MSRVMRVRVMMKDGMRRRALAGGRNGHDFSGNPHRAPILPFLCREAMTTSSMVCTGPRCWAPPSAL
jgi:hypothetical protein